jgi:hypothetical protein
MRRLAGEHRAGLEVSNDTLAGITRKKHNNIRLAAIGRNKTRVLARCVRKAGSFTKVPFEDAQLWERLRSENPERLEGYSREIVSFRIDWRQRLSQVEKDALAWLRQNHRCKLTKEKRGRHAKEAAKYRDALRRLAALRLWARYPLKEAMKITDDYGVHLYSTYFDGDGRPAHQTAWENGVKGVVKLLQNEFMLSETELPLSWQRRGFCVRLQQAERGARYCGCD